MEARPMPTITLAQLNTQEVIILAEIENLEAQLAREMEQDHDPNNPFSAILTLKIICRQTLAKHRELMRIKDQQIASLKMALRSYGA
jgi:hypothetical protein